MPDEFDFEITDPSGDPDDVKGIGGGFENPEEIPPQGQPMTSGLVLPESFIKALIQGPFNVANAYFGEKCPPLSPNEVNGGVVPIQMWIEEMTRDMSIQKPGQFMALLYIGSLAVPRFMAVSADKVSKAPKKTKPVDQAGTQDQKTNPGGDFNDDLFIPAEEL